MYAGLNLGIGLVIAGLVFVILVWGALRLLPRAPVPAGGEVPSLPSGAASSEDAVVVIQTGGHVQYVNSRAREWFELGDSGAADLERLLRRVRPANEFLEVCAAPGHRRLNVNGRPVEATSYQVPGAYPQMLVSLRGLELAPALEASGGEFTSSLLRIVTDFGQSITSSLDLESVVRSVIDSTLRLVPADVLEVKAWDSERRDFVVYRHQETDGRSPTLVRVDQSQFGYLTEQVVASRNPLLLSDSASVAAAEAGRNPTGLRSYLALPLVAGSELVGVLEAGQTLGAPFTSQELDLLQLVSSQTASAIRNAMLFEQERRRSAELSGLAGLAQAVGAIREPEELFSHLVDSISPLVDADILGFLVWDETRRTLAGQVPFRGLPRHIVQIYRVQVSPGTDAEKILERRSPIVTSNAAADSDWRTLGLTDVAVAASLRDSILLPLISSGRMVGYLQVSHLAHGGGTLPESELRLLQIIADQAAAIIDNSLIVRQSREQVLRTDALRRVAEQATVATTQDEILARAVKELTDLLKADLGAVLLLDEIKGSLALHAGSALGIPAATDSTAALALPLDDAEYMRTVTASRRALRSDRVSVDAGFLRFYALLLSGAGVESVVGAPLVVHGRSIGELLLGSRQQDYFTDYDSQLLSTAAVEIAAGLEALRLATETDPSLRKRIEELRAVARVSRELGGSLGIDRLLEVIHQETVRAVGADCGSILLLDSDDLSVDPRRLQSSGCEYGDTLTQLERRALQDGKSISIPDFTKETQSPPHEGVLSALFVPVLEGDRPIALIQLHSGRASAFDDEARETVATLAVQAASAISNARRMQGERREAELLRRRAETLERFSTASYALHPELPLAESLSAIAEGIRESTPFRTILISVYEPETGMLRRVAGAGIEPETLAELQARKQPYSNLLQLIKPEFKISRSYYIPADQTPVLPADMHYVYASQYSEAEARQNAWDPDDFLLLPLYDAEENPLGLISLDDPSNGLRPDRATIESVELFAGQTVQVLTSARRLAELNGRIEGLSAGLNRQQQLLSVTQNDLPVLLRKDLEQTIALHDLNRRAQRIRAGLTITESVSRQLDSNSALLALGRETLTQLGMSMALVGENTAEGSRLAHVLGPVPAGTNAEALFGQRNPLRTCLQTGAAILIPNLDDNDEWRDSSLLNQLRAKSVVCLPILVEDQTVAAMMAVSTEPVPSFTEEDRQVYFQISRQASVVLQNISLLNETRRRLHEVNILLEFSRRLSGLDPSQIVRALLESSRHALTSAHAGAVLLWNEQSHRLEMTSASGYADDESMMQISYQRGEALPGAVFAALKARRVDEINFPRDYVLDPENLGLYRRATGGRLPVASMLVPIIVDEQGIGLIVLDNFNTPAAFHPEDEALMVSLSQQAALSLENVRLVRALTERAGQLEGLNEAATAMTSSLRSDQLANALLDRVGLILPFDSATLWMRAGDKLTVTGVRGFPDTEKRLGLSVDVEENPLFEEIAASGQPISVADVRQDRRFPQVEAPRLSWLGIPMVAKGQLTGLLALEKWQAGFYSREQVQLGMTLASQAAIALENANLYEESVRRATELDERSQRLALLNRFSSALSGLLDTRTILELTARETQQALKAGRVSVVSFDSGAATWVAAAPSVRQSLPQPLPHAPLFDRLRQSQGTFSTENASAEKDLAPLRDFLGRTARRLLVLPLAGAEDLLALVFVQGTDGAGFGSAETDLARTIANQASIALENARSYQSTVETAGRLSLLNESAAEIAASLDPEQTYTAIHAAAARLMPVDGFVIALMDEQGQQVEGVYLTDGEQRLPEKRVRLGQGLASQVIRKSEPMSVTGAPGLRELDVITINPLAVSAVAVPMFLGERTIGVLSARSNRPEAYSVQDMQILGTLASQAAVTIQNARLFGETQRLAQELEQRVAERTAQLRQEQQNTETLLRILTEVSSTLDLDRALNRTLSLLNNAVRAEQGTIMLLNAEDNQLHYRAGYGYLSDRIGPDQRMMTLKMGEGLAGWVVENREAVLVDDVEKDPRWTPTTSASRENRSAIIAPLMVGDDVIGVLMVFSRAEAYFSAEGLALVKAIANQVAVAINNAHLYELIRDQAERLSLMLRKEQEEASRSQAILESVADGVLVTGPENRVAFANSSVERILGVKPEKLVGQSLQAFSGLFGSTGSAWIEAIHRWAAAPDAYEPGDSYAERLELGDNRIALVHLAPVMLEGDFLGTVSILRDITHEVEVDRLKSEFVATVSHELRTPMTSIRGYVEMLLMGAAGAINENQSHFLDIVKKNIDRLNSLVDDLLDISRIESGKVTLTLQPVDLGKVAADLIAELQRTSDEEKKPMTFSLKAARSLPKVLGDAERVRQILQSLLDNAYHYTPEAGAVQVQLRSLKKQGEVQVDVVDNGPGISPSDQERVFERFFRGENPLVLATPGTGLGLSIVRQLVEMHHGRIWVKSDGVEGHGSTFSFTLPIYEGPESIVEETADGS